MKISKISVNRPVTTIMCILVAVVLGIVSLSRLSVDLLPDIEVPMAVVSTDYSNVGPEEVEKFVTKPVEQALATVEGIENISSVSKEGNSLIIAEFEWGTDMEFATLHMREKVDMISGYLPDGVSDPMILKIDPNAQATMLLSVTGDKGLAEIQSFVEDKIQPNLEKVSGVASANINGGFEKIVEVNVDSAKLQGYGLSVSYISQIMAAENINLPAGNVNNGSNELLVRMMGEFKSIDEIKNIPIPLKTGGVVLLSDIAEVSYKNKDIEQESILNGKKCISISIQKQSGANTVSVSNNVKKELEKLKETYPQVQIDVIVDNAEYINMSIDNVKNIAIQGGLLAVLVLLLFLRNVRSTLIISTAIPISIIATFLLLYFMGITINLITLGGLALGVGMLVDSSIVVLENIYRYIQEGESIKQASIDGASEVATSVIASTLTTVAVFLPIAFTEGLTGMIFRDLSFTVVFSIIASLVVSLTLIPMLSSKLLKREQIMNIDKQKKGFLGKVGASFEKGFKALEEKYKKLLNWALIHRKATIIAGIGIFLISIASLVTVGGEFFPATDSGEFAISVDLPKGSSINETKEITNRIEEIVLKQDEVESIFVEIGGANNFGMSSGENHSSLSVKLTSLRDRKRSTADVMDIIRKETRDVPGAEFDFTLSNVMSMSSAPVELKIKGNDLEKLKALSDEVEQVVNSVEGTRQVESSLGDGEQELRIKLNRQAASQYGFTTAQIATQINDIISGKTATQYRVDGEEIDIVIKGDNVYKESISNLKNINIESPAGITVPLELVAELDIERGPTQINRANQSRTVTITSQIYGRDLQSIITDVESKLSEMNMPEGYSYEVGGESQQMNEAFSDLRFALMLSIVLVYMILASQFESLLNPFVIMFSVPLAYAGGALGLFITRTSLSVVAIMGLIILTGIVVNNAIVLIDYIVIRRNMGQERKEAILQAGPTRLRPILMTAATTILGLLPMALGLGEGAEMQAPMAIVVIGGLLYSTLLTLVFIPVLYTLFDDLKNKITGKKEIELNSEEVVL